MTIRKVMKREYFNTRVTQTESKCDAPKTVKRNCEQRQAKGGNKSNSHPGSLGNDRGLVINRTDSLREGSLLS